MTISPNVLHDRSIPIGAEVLNNGPTHFRVWAPKPHTVQLALSVDAEDRRGLQRFPMEAEAGGYFSLTSPVAKAGMRYGFCFDGNTPIYSDPASRFQPEGLPGLSEIINPRTFTWSDQQWMGVKPTGQVLYEMHVGTFTPEGTFAAAVKQLPELARIDITVIEVMPLAEFPGTFGWGYDGVLMFAPTRLYGRPDDLRRFVDRAHALGMGVILDVVYNHFGNAENHLGEFTECYKSQAYKNEWGDAINFDGEHSGPVREFFAANAYYWVDEFHLDGFRFDATQQIFDRSAEHILIAVKCAAKKAAGARQVYFAAENEPQNITLLQPVEQGGYALDALWNDDFHHSAHVRLTGTNPAYYSDYLGTVGELAAALKHGFIYQGQQSCWQHKPRGTPTFGQSACSFVNFLENHDQIANSATGERIHQLSSPGRLRALTALWLLAPQTPMFFQGQEFAASTPFFYFADFSGELGESVSAGRAKFLSQFPNLADEESQRLLPNPSDPAVFQQCKLNFSKREANRHLYDLHIDLLRLRRKDAVFRKQDTALLETAVLSADCLVVRYLDSARQDRLVIANFGRDLRMVPIPEPLLAPPREYKWTILWNSNQRKYGGPGITAVEQEAGWSLPGEATVVLRAIANSDE